jgi:hypothetical protein
MRWLAYLGDWLLAWFVGITLADEYREDEGPE